MTDDSPQELPPMPAELRFDYAGACWWCGGAADSREHKYKRSDLVREFGAGPWEQQDALVRSPGGSKPLHPVRGPNANALKFGRSLCQDCNNKRSQPFDYAYDAFAEYVAQRERPIVTQGWLKLSDVFGANWRAQRTNVVRYYAKHIGCRLADDGVKVPQSFVNFMNGRAWWPWGLDLHLGIRLDILELEEHMSKFHESFGGSVWLGGLNGQYSNEGQAIEAVWSHSGVGALRASYTVYLGGSRFRSNLRSNKVRIPGEFNLPPGSADRGCRECNGT